MDWLVNIKGGSETGPWEISVIHADNKHGFQSYGWFCKEKILISKGGGHSSPWGISKFVFAAQLAVADEVAKRLNNGEAIE